MTTPPLARYSPPTGDHTTSSDETSPTGCGVLPHTSRPRDVADVAAEVPSSRSGRPNRTPRRPSRHTVGQSRPPAASPVSSALPDLRDRFRGSTSRVTRDSRLVFARSRGRWSRLAPVGCPRQHHLGPVVAPHGQRRSSPHPGRQQQVYNHPMPGRVRGRCGHGGRVRGLPGHRWPARRYPIGTSNPGTAAVRRATRAWHSAGSPSPGSGGPAAATQNSCRCWQRPPPHDHGTAARPRQGRLARPATVQGLPSVPAGEGPAGRRDRRRLPRVSVKAQQGCASGILTGGQARATARPSRGTAGSTCGRVLG